MRKRFLNTLNKVASVLHLSWGILFSCLWYFNKNDHGERRDIIYPLYTSYSSWNATAIELPKSGGCSIPRSISFGDITVSPAWKDAGINLSLHWLVTSFFFLSAFFQFLGGVVPRKTVPNPVIRFIEYSVSASVMIVAIALQLGIFQAQVLLLLATLTWTTMICGIVAETLAPGDREPVEENKLVKKLLKRMNAGAWLSHGIGWMTQLIVFFVLLQQFHGSQNTCGSTRAAPYFVWAIVYVELVLFASFGFVQSFQLTKNLSAERAEISYTVLSFVSKSLLGLLVYAGNFMG